LPDIFCSVHLNKRLFEVCFLMVQHVSSQCVCVCVGGGGVSSSLTSVVMLPVFLREAPLLGLLSPPDRLEGTDNKHTGSHTHTHTHIHTHTHKVTTRALRNIKETDFYKSFYKVTTNSGIYALFTHSFRVSHTHTQTHTHTHSHTHSGPPDLPLRSDFDVSPTR